MSSNRGRRDFDDPDQYEDDQPLISGSQSKMEKMDTSSKEDVLKSNLQAYLKNLSISTFVSVLIFLLLLGKYQKYDVITLFFGFQTLMHGIIFAGINWQNRIVTDRANSVFFFLWCVDIGLIICHVIGLVIMIIPIMFPIDCNQIDPTCIKYSQFVLAEYVYLISSFIFTILLCMWHNYLFSLGQTIEKITEEGNHPKSN